MAKRAQGERITTAALSPLRRYGAEVSEQRRLVALAAQSGSRSCARLDGSPPLEPTAGSLEASVHVTALGCSSFADALLLLEGRLLPMQRRLALLVSRAGRRGWFDSVPLASVPTIRPPIAPDGGRSGQSAAHQPL